MLLIMLGPGLKDKGVGGEHGKRAALLSSHEELCEDGRLGLAEVKGGEHYAGSV